MTDQINASHLLVKTEAEALECLNLINKGNSFESIARLKSICPSKSDGGSLGWFSRGQMVKEFEDATFSGKLGEIVGPVKTEFGFHLIKIKKIQ